MTVVVGSVAGPCGTADDVGGATILELHVPQRTLHFVLSSIPMLLSAVHIPLREGRHACSLSASPLQCPGVKCGRVVGD